MIVKIALYNIYILGVLIVLLLAGIFLLLIKNKLKLYLSTRLATRIRTRYENLSPEEFKQWIRKTGFISGIVDDQLAGWLENPDTQGMAELIVSELEVETRWIDKAREGLWWIRALYARRLGLIGTASSLPVLKANLDCRNPDVFFNSALSLLKIGDRDTRQQVTLRVLEADWISVSRAIDLLNINNGPQVEILQQKFAGASERQQQIILGTALRSRNKDEYEGLIIRAFRDEDLEVRLRAIKSAAFFKTDRVKEYLLSFLGSPVWEERALSANSLANFSGDEVPEALYRTLFDENWWVRNNCARSLARMGQPGIYYLSRVLMSDNEQARDIAYHYLNSDHNLYLALKDRPLTGGKMTDHELARDLSRRVYAQGVEA